MNYWNTRHKDNSPPSRFFCYVSEYFVIINGMIWLKLLRFEVSMSFIVQSSWWRSTHGQHSGHLPNFGLKTCSSGKNNLCNLKHNHHIDIWLQWVVLQDFINPCANVTWIVIDCKWNMAYWLWVWNIVASQLIWMYNNNPVIKRCIV